MRTACDSASPIVFVLWLNLVYALIFFVFESTNLPSKYFFGCHDSGEVAAATTESKTTFFPTNRAGRKRFTFFVLYSLYLDDNELTPFTKAERRGKIECPFVHDAAVKLEDLNILKPKLRTAFYCPSCLSFSRHFSFLLQVFCRIDWIAVAWRYSVQKVQSWQQTDKVRGIHTRLAIF